MKVKSSMMKVTVVPWTVEELLSDLLDSAEVKCEVTSPRDVARRCERLPKVLGGELEEHLEVAQEVRMMMSEVIDDACRTVGVDVPGDPLDGARPLGQHAV